MKSFIHQELDEEITYKEICSFFHNLIPKVDLKHETKLKMIKYISIFEIEHLYYFINPVIIRKLSNFCDFYVHPNTTYLMVYKYQEKYFFIYNNNNSDYLYELVAIIISGKNILEKI